MYEARVERHSVSKAGVELVTFEVNYPHAVHKDIMTHRWARNFQSFRAVPPEKLLKSLRKGEYFIPEVFGSRIKGMGQGRQDEIDQQVAAHIWQRHVEDCINKAERFLSLDISKQQVNFLLQDLCFIRGIITTTLPQLENFFGLRLELKDDGTPQARPEVYKIASMMKAVYEESTPVSYAVGNWHLPFVSNDELMAGKGDWDFWKKISVARCARVSYLTHNGERDPEKDIALADQLLDNGHMSPFEHQGTPIAEPWYDGEKTGCFGNGWRQYRKFIPGEANYLRRNEKTTDLDGTYVIN